MERLARAPQCGETISLCNGMAALARTPVLPGATLAGTLSAQLRRRRRIGYGCFTSTPDGYVRRVCANSCHSLTLIAAVGNDCVDSSPDGGPWLELKLGDRDCLRSSISPQRLRGHAEGPQEGTTHAFAVRKTRFLRDQFYRVPAPLHHVLVAVSPRPLLVSAQSRPETRG